VQLEFFREVIDGYIFPLQHLYGLVMASFQLNILYVL
jgi:hypothetical protein